jgi:hypothetical protein
MREIPLSKGLVAIVDDDDFEALSQSNWYAKKEGRTYYAYKTERMHSLILRAPRGMSVDHLDGNGLNNQKSNLRVVTHRVNCQNKHSPKSSIYPGVSWRKDRKKWAAKISIGGKGKYLGQFDNEVDAARAYVRACEELLE